MHRVLAIVARLFLSLGFLLTAADTIMGWKGAEKELMQVVSDWQTYTIDSPWLQSLFSMMAVWAPLLLMFNLFLEVLGGILLVLGWHEKIGAFLLVLVQLPQLILVQHFWFTESSIFDLRLDFFLKDLAILGGLLVVLLRGTKEMASPIHLDRESDFG